MKTKTKKESEPLTEEQREAAGVRVEVFRKASRLVKSAAESLGQVRQLLKGEDGAERAGELSDELGMFAAQLRGESERSRVDAQ